MEVTKVYVLYLGNLGDGRTGGVFSSKEKAQDHLVQRHRFWLESGEWSIIPHELDEGW